jgi:hypothetical protein
MSVAASPCQKLPCAPYKIMCKRATCSCIGPPLGRRRPRRGRNACAHRAADRPREIAARCRVAVEKLHLAISRSKGDPIRMRRTASYVHRVFSNYQTTRPCASGAFGSCDARGKTARVVNPPTRHHPRVGALSARRCVRDRVPTDGRRGAPGSPPGRVRGRGPARTRIPVVLGPHVGPYTWYDMAAAARPPRLRPSYASVHSASCLFGEITHCYDTDVCH